MVWEAIADSSVFDCDSSVYEYHRTVLLVLLSGYLVSSWIWVVAFSSLARILEECSTVHSPHALFLFCFKVEISSRTLIPLCRPGSVHSGELGQL